MLTTPLGKLHTPNLIHRFFLNSKISRETEFTQITMNLKLFFCAFILTSVKAQPTYFSDDELNKFYFYHGKYDRKLWQKPAKLVPKSEFNDYCGNSNSFIGKVAFGLIFDSHDFMSNLSRKLSEDVNRDFDNLDKYFIQRAVDYDKIKPKSFYEHDAVWATKLEEEYFDKTIEIKRNIDYLKNTLLDLYSVNTNHGSAALVSADIYLKRYTRAARNLEEIVVGSLILDIVNKTLSSDIGNVQIVIGLLTTVDILNEKEQNIDLATTILLSMFAVLLDNDKTYSESMLLVAEKAKVSMKKFYRVRADDKLYNRIRNKFKFILFNLSAVIRNFVWDVPRNQDNLYCIKNTRYGKSLLILEDPHGNPMLVTGKPSLLLNNRFSIKFDQKYMHYEIDSPYYRKMLEQKTKPLPYHKFFLIPSEMAFYIKSFENDDEHEVVFLRDGGSANFARVEFHKSNSFEDLYSQFAGAVQWNISVCVS